MCESERYIRHIVLQQKKLKKDSDRDRQRDRDRHRVRVIDIQRKCVFMCSPHSITVGWLQQSSLMTDSIAYSAIFPTNHVKRKRKRKNTRAKITYESTSTCKRFYEFLSSFLCALCWCCWYFCFLYLLMVCCNVYIAKACTVEQCMRVTVYNDCINVLMMLAKNVIHCSC